MIHYLCPFSVPPTNKQTYKRIRALYSVQLVVRKSRVCMGLFIDSGGSSSPAIHHPSGRCAAHTFPGEIAPRTHLRGRGSRCGRSTFLNSWPRVRLATGGTPPIVWANIPTLYKCTRACITFSHSRTESDQVHSSIAPHSSRDIYLPKIAHPSLLSCRLLFRTSLFEFLKRCVQCSRLPLERSSSSSVSSFLIVDTPNEPELTESSNVLT